MKKHILITSISAKVPLIKTVIKSKNKFDKSISVYGGDIDENCIARYFVDNFIFMSNLEIMSIDDFIAVCDSREIKYIIPTRDADVLYFSGYKKKLLNNGIYLFAPNIDTVKICFDKLEFSARTKDMLSIPSSKDIREINSAKYVVKERFGSGSNNIALNVDKTTALKFSKRLKETIYQPYIQGQEFSIDSYVAKNKKCIACIVRSRDIVKNGESQISTYVYDEFLEKKIISFVESLNITGHSVTQVIKHNNTYSIIECNTRFGGASTLSYKMGLESFYWFLLEVADEKINFKLNNTKLQLVRIAEDQYFEC
ncbi:MAG: ATP-grasp domain-containing protein [Sulfurimonas sp.]|nr:ATP-grasp domain-containing protein [Sulfurimonas sp.]MDQ7059860.1 ATP-grasp domain-containing protein [Sulfurimonas sp.]